MSIAAVLSACAGNFSGGLISPFGQLDLISLRQDLIEDVGEDATSIVVVDFGWGIQPDF
jgi:hypothetical protein